MERVTREAHRLHAHGVVGVTIERSGADARPRRRRHDLPRPHHRDARARHRDRRGAPRRAAAGDVPRPTSWTGRSHERRAGALRPHLDWPACPSTGASAWSGCATAASSPATSRSTSSCSCKAAGFEPLGLVVGTSIYHIGFQIGAWSQNQEMDVLTQAMYHARELAMTRMEEEADQLGADGIVAVRLEVSRARVGQRPRRVRRHRHRRAPPRGRAAPRAQRPARSRATSPARTSTRCSPPATGRSGMVHGDLRLPRRPPGPAAAGCGGSVATPEMPNFTQALYDARELAMERMQAEAEALEAEGIVGVAARRGQPRLELARHRVLLDRHRGHPDERHARDPAADATLTLNDSRQDRLTGF